MTKLNGQPIHLMMCGFGFRYKLLGRWEEAAIDLRAALKIDFDPTTEAMRKEVEEYDCDDC